MFLLGCNVFFCIFAVDFYTKHKNSYEQIHDNPDLADAVGADADKMVSDAQKLNPNIKIIKSSLKEGIGLDEIIAVIEEAKNNV